MFDAEWIENFALIVKKYNSSAVSICDVSIFVMDLILEHMLMISIFSIDL